MALKYFVKCYLNDVKTGGFVFEITLFQRGAWYSERKKPKKPISKHLEFVGRRIRVRRLEKKLHLKDLAKIVGCSYSLLSLAERGLAKMEMDKYLVIAEALDVDPGLLLSKKEMTDEQFLFILNAIKIGIAEKPTPHYDSIRQLMEIDVKSLEK